PKSSGVNFAWDPLSFKFTRSTSNEVIITAITYLYIDRSLNKANFTLSEHSGWSNITLYNYNGPVPTFLASFLDTTLRSYMKVIPAISMLTGAGPVFTVSDTLRNAMPKTVLAHYYGWYNQQNWIGGRNCTACPSVTGVPVLGFYDSHNMTVMDSQITLAKA